MSAALERLKQHSEQAGQQPRPETSESMMTTLTSILDVVEAQRRQLTTLTEGQKKLASFVKVMDEQQTLQTDRLTEVMQHASTSLPSEPTSQPSESVESRLSEIESTLTEFVSALDGKQLRAAASALITEASRNRTDMASATEQTAQQIAASTLMVKQAHGAAERIEKQAGAAIRKVTSAAADATAAQLSHKVRTAEVRTEKVMALVARVEARQLWSATGAMCLALLPAATVVLGGILIVAGIVFGWEVAVTTEAATWLRWVKGIGAVLGTGCALVGLAAAVHWVVGHINTWSASRPRQGRR